MFIIRITDGSMIVVTTLWGEPLPDLDYIANAYYYLQHDDGTSEILDSVGYYEFLFKEAPRIYGRPKSAILEIWTA